PQLDIPIEHVQTRQLLELPEGQDHLSVAQLMEQEDLLKRTVMGLKVNDAYKKELNKLLTRLRVYTDIQAGENWLLPHVLPNKSVEWVPLDQFLTEEKIQSLSQTTSDPFKVFFTKTIEDY